MFKLYIAINDESGDVDYHVSNHDTAIDAFNTFARSVNENNLEDVEEAWCHAVGDITVWEYGRGY